MLGVPADDMLPAPQTDEELRAMAERIANNPNQEKYESFKVMADEEIATIQAKLMEAEQMRQQMPDVKKREILG